MTDIALVKAAMRLREASPQAWVDFLAAMKQRSEKAAFDLVNAPDDMVFLGQGRARAIAELCKELTEAPQTYEKVMQNERSRPAKR